MLLYSVSKFNRRGRAAHRPNMLYLGQDLKEAKRIAFELGKPTSDSIGSNYPELFSALPTTVGRKVLRYHKSGYIWIVIEQIEFKENE